VNYMNKKNREPKKQPKSFERLCLLVFDGSGPMEDHNPQAK